MDNREADNAGHPPACTCVECAQRRRGTCPKCGSPKIYYSRRFALWRCGKCEASFPSPSYKLGTPEGLQWEYPWNPNHVGYAKGEIRNDKKGNVAGCIVSVVILLVVAGLGFAGWNAYGGEITDFFKGATVTNVSEDSFDDTEDGTRITTKDVYPPYSTGFLGSPIRLVNNENATDPTWSQLRAFLVKDETDQGVYKYQSYMCGSFAEEVHNNAEEAGIRAAWVSIDFEGDSPGHALNAFETTDKGLVYIDCTGSGFAYFVPSGEYSPEGGMVFTTISDYDKVAYISVGEEYGSISLDVASSPTYPFYMSYKTSWDNYDTAVDYYNGEVEKYEDALGGRFILQEPEYSYFMDWYNRLEDERMKLDRQSSNLGEFFWEPLGIVTEVEFYW